jgi:hypothetical protein
MADWTRWDPVEGLRVSCPRASYTGCGFEPVVVWREDDAREIAREHDLWHAAADEAIAGDTLCHNCGHPIRRKDGSSTGWTHGGAHRRRGWQGVRCPRKLTGAVPHVSYFDSADPRS